MRSPSRALRLAASVLALSALTVEAGAQGGQPYFRLQVGRDANGVPTNPGNPVPGTDNPGTVNPDPTDTNPVTVSGSDMTVRQGQSVSARPGTASGGTGTYTWTVSQGPLPDGLQLAADGTVTGIPARPGTSTVSLSVTDGEGRTKVAGPFKVVVMGLPTISYSLYRMQPGAPVDLAPNLTDIRGPVRFASVGAAFPGTLAVNQSTGHIVGDPGPGGITPGLQVGLVDSDGSTASTTPFSIDVSTSQAKVFGQDATVRTGVPFSLTFQGQGLAAPVTYTRAGAAWPPGIDIDQSAGRLAGTPTTAGTYAGLMVKARDASGVEVTSVPFTVTVNAASVSNPGTLTVPLNKDYSYAVTSRYLEPGATWVWSGSAPPGLTFDGGTIKGVPTTPGTYGGLQVTAVDSGGSFPSGTFTIVVNPDSLQVLASPAKVRQGSVATIAPTLLPAGRQATWAIEGTQPAGMSFDASTGILSGIPSVSGGGFDITATSGGLLGRSDPLSVSVYPTLTATSAPVGAMVGTLLDQAFTSSGVIGTGTWRLVSGALPDGLSLRSDGHVVGTPTAAANATGLVARLTDDGDGSQADTQPFNVTVAASDRMLVTGLSGIYGTRVNRRLALPAPTVQNAQGSPTFSVSGALPAGITVDRTTGVVNGTATSPGNGEPLQVTATDARPSTASSPSFAVRLVGPLSIDGTSDVTVQAGAYLTSSVAAHNLMGSGQFALLPAGTVLPPGVRFEQATGRIVGRPTAAATLTGLTVQVTDTVDGETATSAPFAMTVTPALVVDGPTYLAARVGQPFTSASSFVVRNATGRLTWRLSSGTLPSGLSLDVNTGAITGTPTQQIRQNNLVLHVDQEDGLFGETPAFSIEAVGAMGITVGTLQQARANVSYAITPTVTNAVGAVTWNIAQGSPPPGMNFDPTTGRIYGVTSTTGTFSGLRLHAKDGIGQEATTDTITFQIGDIIRVAYTTGIPDQRFGSRITPVKPFTVTGAVGAYTLTANYPSGMVLSPDGTLSGTWGSTGCCPYVTVTATDSTGATGSVGYGFGGKQDTVYLSGRDAQWVHSASTTYPGVTNKAYSFYTSSGPGVDGLWDYSRRHFELKDPTQLQPWMSFSQYTGDIYGTPTAPGNFRVDVVAVDDVDGTRSAPHTYVMPITDGGTIVNAGAYHIRTRVGRSFSKFPIDVNNGNYTKRAPGWCKASFTSSMPSGVYMNLGGDCSVWNYPWDVANQGTWNGLWIEATDDNGVTTHVDFDVQVAAPLYVRSAAVACTRTPGATIKQGPESVSNLMGNATFKLTNYWGDPATPPAGMAFNAADGTISGVPTAYFRAGNQGGDPYKVTVTDDWDGSTDYAMIGMEYRRPLGNWNNGSRQLQYKRYDGFTLDGSGLDPSSARTWTIVSGSPPPGVNFTWDNYNAYLRGAPTRIGAYDMTARIVTDCPAGTTADVPVHWDVAPALASNAPDVSMREGVYSRTAPAPAVEYGQQPISWGLQCCKGLPQGITMDSGTGQLVGTPAAGTAGTYTYSLQPSDRNGYINTPGFTLLILPAPSVTYASVSGKVGSPITAAPQTSNVAGPATFTSSGSAIPPDLGIGIDPASGTLSGRPTRTANLDGLKVTVTDSSGLSASSNAFSVAVSPGSTATMATPLQASAGTAFSAAPVAKDTSGATTWSVASGTLPLGLRLDAASGTISGRPGLQGTTDGIVLAVADASGGVAQTNPFSIVVAPGQVTQGAMGLYCITAYNNARNAGGAPNYQQQWFSGPAANVDTQGATPTCRINLWDVNVNNGLYQDWKGLSQLYDGLGRQTGTLGASYDWVVVTDVASGRQYPSGTDIGWILSNYVTGPGTFSRTFNAVGQVSGTGELRSSGNFILTGSYGAAKQAVTEDPNDPSKLPRWFWDKQQCITTCNQWGLCDARQYQVCQGSGCTETVRTCYNLYNQYSGAATSSPSGTEAAQCVYAQYGAALGYCP